jgi:hypothetical protein
MTTVSVDRLVFSNLSGTCPTCPVASGVVAPKFPLACRCPPWHPAAQVVRHRARRRSTAPKSQTPSSEHGVQSAFFKALSDIEHPAARLAYAIPNGALGPKMSRQVWFAAEGVKGGVPDVHVPWPTKKHPGLWIEFKYGNNEPSKKQLWWLKALQAAGHRVVVAYSLEEGLTAFYDYLGLTRPVPTE